VRAYFFSDLAKGRDVIGSYIFLQVDLARSFLFFRGGPWVASKNPSERTTKVRVVVPSISPLPFFTLPCHGSNPRS